MGSLTARLILVMLLPTATLGLIGYRDVARRHQVHDDATKVSAQVALLRASEPLLVPLFREYGATHGLQEAERVGVSLDDLRAMVPIDFLTLTIDARRDLDAGIEELLSGHGDVTLPDGRTIRETLTLLARPLAETRAAFDDNDLLRTDLDNSFGVLITMLDEIGVQSVIALADAAGTNDLAHIAIETRSFVYAFHYLTDGLSAVIDSANATDGTQMYEMVASSGAFNSAIERLATILTPDRAAGLAEVLALPSFAAVEAAQTRWLLAVSDAVLTTQSVAARAEAVAAVSDLLVASFQRMNDLQGYGLTFLREEAALTEQVQAQAQASERNAIMWAVVAIGATLVLLVLVVWSVLRPVRALLRSSEQVREGDLDVPTVRPTGPTDIRTLTQTFNEMVVTLRAFDAQVQRMARGETDVDQPLPGPLGQTLRDSVDHLLDVTNELHRSEAAAVVQARTDALTGLANRTAVLEHLAEIGAATRTSGEPGAIVYLDLDGFKNVNDTQGHGAGDRILRQIGTRLQHACPNCVVARMGGDEFIVLIERAGNIERVEAFAQQLIGLVSQPCEARDGQQFMLTASAGVTLVDGECQPLECIAQADSAVYRAKEEGRSRVEAYDERLAAEIETRSEMALMMRRSLEHGGFTLHLQPIVELADNQPVGAEALLRWTLPDGRSVGPAEFIPIAERTGVILAIDEWVITHAMEVLAAWQAHPATAGFQLAINISGRHITDGALPQLVAAKSREAGVDPRFLSIEVTETYLMADAGRARVVLDDLHVIGVRVSIDDFGTGYSSMSSLHELPADVIKIDRVFVAGLTRSGTDRTIVELVLRLAESLGMEVIAEGVGSEDELTHLRLLGCQMAQGFHLAMPMPVDECTEWLCRHAHTAVPR
ncbi:MAG: GGDEF domain-containing protein [Actinomycetota bacterium]|nr:GGDEF domain-containing protein [Actinomycetota bacterium]